MLIYHLSSYKAGLVSVTAGSVFTEYFPQSWTKYNTIKVLVDTLFCLKEKIDYHIYRFIFVFGMIYPGF